MLTKLSDAALRADDRAGACADEKYVVLDQREWRLIAEAHAQKDRDTVVALAPGNYRVKRVLSDHLEVGSMALAAGDHANVDKLTYESAPLVDRRAEGRSRETCRRRSRPEWSRCKGSSCSPMARPPRRSRSSIGCSMQTSPGDLESWRGRSRCAGPHGRGVRAGRRRAQRDPRALGDALKADPSLADDPLFAIWYRRLGEMQGRAVQIDRDAKAYERDIEHNPRKTKTFAVGFDIFSGSGMFTANVGLVIKRVLFPRIGFDFETLGFDASIGIAPLQSRREPIPRASAAHISLNGSLGITHPGMSSNAVTDNTTGQSYSDNEIWGQQFRVEGGAQYVGSLGFTTELGLAMMVFKADDGTTHQQAWPVFHFGWLW